MKVSKSFDDRMRTISKEVEKWLSDAKVKKSKSKTGTDAKSQ